VDAQKLRKAGSLVAARDALVTCGQGSCPEIVRDKCVEWLPEVEAEIPTVVLVAKSSAGGDVDGVEVRIDQEGGARSIDGRPIALDPGEHVFEFRHGAERKLERAVLTSRQKDRRIEVTFGTRAEARARTDDAAAAPPARSSAWPLSVYVLGGVGVVALGSFGYFGFTALDEKSSLEDECAPRCTEDQKEGVDRKLLFADISLGVAAVSLGGDQNGRARPAAAAARSREACQDVFRHAPDVVADHEPLLDLDGARGRHHAERHGDVEALADVDHEDVGALLAELGELGRPSAACAAAGAHEVEQGSLARLHPGTDGPGQGRQRAPLHRARAQAHQDLEAHGEEQEPPEYDGDDGGHFHR